MFNGLPNASEIMCKTVTATGTMITVPAGKWFTGDLTIAATVAVAGASNPVVTVNGTNAAPAAGTVIGRINLAGLALASLSEVGTFGVIALAPAGNDITIDFTAGANGTSSATINGFIFG